jgi:hypothetical protein
MNKTLLKYSWCLCCFLMAFTFAASAQTEVTVKGFVKDSIGGIPSATVRHTDSKNGVSTKQDGQYSIKVPKTSKLVFSFVGYKSKTVAVSDYKPNSEGIYTISVTLLPDASALEEVTVVGFGTQKKTSVISSIISINPKELKGPTSNLTTMLAGRVAGMVAYQRSGEPGGG